LWGLRKGGSEIGKLHGSCLLPCSLRAYLNLGFLQQEYVPYLSCNPFFLQQKTVSELQSILLQQESVSELQSGFLQQESVSELQSGFLQPKSI
jgi:hypothetical protein